MGKKLIFVNMNRNRIVFILLLLLFSSGSMAQINTDHVMHTGRTRLYFGNYISAIENFNMVIRVKPYLPEPYFYRGVAKMSLEDFRGAKADLDKALEIKPFYSEAYLYRGMVQYDLGNYSEAMNDYSKALEMDGENADVYNNRGICKAAMHNMEGAIEDYSKSIELSPKNFNAHLNRSLAYQSLEEWDKAIGDCNQLIRIKPNSPMGYMSRGMIKIEKKDYAGALRDFDMAIRFDPQNAFAYHNRGLVKQQLESYEAAIIDYDQAIALNGQMASAYFNRAIAKEISGRNDYQSDYKYAELLDERFAKRPWQTEAEREEQQRQMLTQYQQQANQQTPPNVSGQEPEDQAEEQISKEEPDIDYEELKKRKMKANLVMADNREKPGENVNERRVQDRNVPINLLDMFSVIAISKKTVDNDNIGYFNLTVEQINAASNYDPYLTVSNQIFSSPDSRAYYNNQVLMFDERIKQNPNVTINYVYRGLFKTLWSSDYNAAIADFDKALKIDDRNLIAYFLRATTRTKMLEAILSVQQQQLHNNILGNDLGISSGASLKNNMDVEEILIDYLAILYMNPEFFFAYYNRGNLYVKLEKYAEAMEEYTKAISIEPDFAEAYYNRGLVKILLNNIDGAASDLSRAGELGIEAAYNVIKRYCN